MRKPKKPTVKDLLEADWRFDDSQPLALGCYCCFLQTHCGGLRVAGGAIDCLRFCCRSKDCQITCFGNPELYAKRIEEVRGLSLNNIPRCDSVSLTPLTGYAPLLHHAYSREKPYEGACVALSLYELIDREGRPAFRTLEEVADRFLFSRSARIIISGVQKDYLLERVWQSPHRESLIQFLLDIRVAMLTPPNFSVYNNVPRPESLYNIKRIAWLAAEFLSAGIPTAIHINAATERDYEIFTEFLSERPEFGAISFEFITGAKGSPQMAWHVSELTKLTAAIGRPLQLVLRGGRRALNPLSKRFENILLLDSNPLQKALQRKEITLVDGTKLGIVHRPLPKSAPVDDLFATNVRSLEEATLAATLAEQKGELPSRAAHDIDHKAGQLDLLTNSSLRKVRSPSADREPVVTTPKA